MGKFSNLNSLIILNFQNIGYFDPHFFFFFSKTATCKRVAGYQTILSYFDTHLHAMKLAFNM